MNSLAELQYDGFTIIPDVLDQGQVESLRASIRVIEEAEPVHQRKGSMYAIRNLMDVVPAVRELASSDSVRHLIESRRGVSAFVVRAILFDKSPDANWKVTWHQDTAIAVQERVEVPGFGPWSIKEGIHHVRPPADVLANMLTIRLHLDDCDESNGALQVLRGSHRHGFLSSEQLTSLRARAQPILCCIPQGGALLMNPLLAHASSSGDSPSRRRVIHLEHAYEPLPNGLEWHRA
ncbi:MAG: phytanoyl-CoA dioxygenase family protein [Planctomycetota bacterium]|nr:phytanoyl-CoA dioxygenase family protein [Planctomycetota bacterium]